MKLFALRTTTEEQKADQSLQLRLFQIFIIIFLTTGSVVLTSNELFGKMPSNRIQDMMYVPSIIILIGLVPSVMKYSWKILLPRTIIITIVVASAILALNRIW
ncbi:MAG: hypothetical protein ACHQM6_07420 [Candidatus Kapaibacterium sp.]